MAFRTHTMLLKLPAKPARKIGMNYRSVTGSEPTRVGPVEYESTLERDFIVLTDVLPGVTVLRGQPLTLDFRGPDGRLCHYTPDFYVEFADGCAWLVEIKYRSDLRDDWAKLKPRFKAAIRHCSAHNGVRFRIFTEVEIRGNARLKNAQLLRTYRERTPNPTIEQHLYQTLRELGATTPDRLLATAYDAHEDRLKAIAHIWRLVLTGAIHADLTQPLTMAAELSPNLASGALV